MQQLKEKLDRHNKLYSNQPEITDDEYEKLLTKYNLLYGEYTPAVDSTSLKLPLFAPSLKKYKLQKDLERWEREYEGDKIISDKIDGISLIVCYTNNTTTIYTHSNSESGYDKSLLLPYLNLPPLKIKEGEKLIVRGELAIKLSVFEKYKDRYTSPRNMITGVINSKDIDTDIIKDFTFLAFQLSFIYTDNTISILNSETQFNLLTNFGFTTVTNIIKVKSVNYEMLKDRLKTIACPYLRDGLVVAQNAYEPITAKDPNNKIAFKVLGDTAETTVIKVEWEESRLQKLKPRIHYDSVFLSQANLTWTSGFNAGFIKKYNIGPGTKLIMTRSGDVNPYILSITEGTSASLPDCEYKWDDSKTEIYVNVNDTIKIKRICHFFDVLGGKFLAFKTIKKLYNYKFDSINKIINITMEDLLTIDSIKKLSAERIFKQINQCVNNSTLPKIMEGSSIFVGFGEVKINNILNHLPSLSDYFLYDTDLTITKNDIEEVEGIQTMAEKFMNYINNFKIFFNELEKIKHIIITNSITLPVIEKKTGNVFNGQVIVFSGDKKLTEQVKLLGGIVDKNVTKRTTLLVVDEVGVMHNKEKVCTQKKIPIISLHDFKIKYNL